MPRLLACAVGLLLLFMLYPKSTGDAALTRHFSRNLSAFTELRSMLATNAPVVPGSQEMSGWSMEHYRRYRELLRQCHVIQVVN
jgi:hypothetical protein